MAYYRLYYFDGPEGRIGSVAEFDVVGDGDAVRTAEAGRRLAAMELWCGGRKVHRWPALPAAALAISRQQPCRSSSAA